MAAGSAAADRMVASAVRLQGVGPTLVSLAKAAIAERARYPDAEYVRLTEAARALLRLAGEVP